MARVAKKASEVAQSRAVSNDSQETATAEVVFVGEILNARPLDTAPPEEDITPVNIGELARQYRCSSNPGTHEVPANVTNISLDYQNRPGKKLKIKSVKNKDKNKDTEDATQTSRIPPSAADPHSDWGRYCATLTIVLRYATDAPIDFTFHAPDSQWRPGYMALSLGHLLAGATIPITKYAARLLIHWNVAPGALSRNSWRIIRDVAKAKIPFDTAVANITKNRLKGKDSSVGFYNLTCNLPLNLVVPEKKDNDKNWKTGWFFVSGPWDPTVSKDAQGSKDAQKVAAKGKSQEKVTHIKSKFIPPNHVLTQMIGLTKICKDLNCQHILPRTIKKRKVPLTAAELSLLNEDTPQPLKKKSKTLDPELTSTTQATVRVSDRIKSKNVKDKVTVESDSTKNAQSKGKAVIEGEDVETDVDEGEESKEKEDEEGENEDKDAETETDDEIGQNDEGEKEEEDRENTVSGEDGEIEIEKNGDNEKEGNERQEKENEEDENQAGGDGANKADSEATEIECDNTAEEVAIHDTNITLVSSCIRLVGDGAIETSAPSQGVLETDEGNKSFEVAEKNDNSGLPTQNPEERDRISDSDTYFQELDAMNKAEMASLFPPVPPDLSDIDFNVLESFMAEDAESLKLSQPVPLDPPHTGVPIPSRLEHTADSFALEDGTSCSPNSCEFGLKKIEKSTLEFCSQLSQACQIMKGDRDHYKKLLAASQKDLLDQHAMYQLENTSLKEQVTILTQEKKILEETRPDSAVMDAINSENSSLKNEINLLSLQDADLKKKLADTELLLHRALEDYESQVKVSQDSWNAASELATEVKQLKSAFVAEMDGLKVSHAEELDAQKKDHNQEILSFHARLKKMKQETSETINASKELHKSALLKYSRTGAYLKGEVDVLKGRPRDKRVPTTCAPSEIEALVVYFVSRFVEAHKAAKAKQDAGPSGSGAADPS